MEFAIPADLPVLSETEAKVISSVPVYNTGHKKDFEANAKVYFERKSVVPMLNTLLTELFIAQPDDPIDHMCRFMLRHPTMPELQTHSQQFDLSKVADSSVSYANKFKLPHMFDELLTALLEDEPEDPSRFAMSWMRWHKNGFIARHVPEGYRAYHVARNSDGSATAAATAAAVSAA